MTTLTVTIEARVMDTQFGLIAYDTRSSLEDCRFQVEVTESSTVPFWKKVPFLWVYQTLPEVPENLQPMANSPYRKFEYFRDCYKGIASDTAIYIEVQKVTFVRMTNDPPHPHHNDETLLYNCFNEHDNAYIYTICVPSDTPKKFLFREYGDLFAIAIE